MKGIAQLLVALSLAVALVAASSAYVVRLDRPDSALAGLALSQAVSVRGSEPTPQEPRPKARPLARAGEVLDEELLATLRAEEVRFVRVRDFALERWDLSWLFGVGVLGLGFGAFLTRRASRLALARREETRDGQPSPAETLGAIRASVEGALAAWPEESHRPDHSEMLLQRLNVAIDEHGPRLVAERELLVSRLGLSGYAALMDRFAAAERQIHRAWSAAADGVLEETRECLERAVLLLDETAEALGEAGR